MDEDAAWATVSGSSGGVAGMGTAGNHGEVRARIVAPPNPVGSPAPEQALGDPFLDAVAAFHTDPSLAGATRAHQIVWLSFADDAVASTRAAADVGRVKCMGQVLLCV